MEPCQEPFVRKKKKKKKRINQPANRGDETLVVLSSWGLGVSVDYSVLEGRTKNLHASSPPPPSSPYVPPSPLQLDVTGVPVRKFMCQLFFFFLPPRGQLESEQHV